MKLTVEVPNYIVEKFRELEIPEKNWGKVYENFIDEIMGENSHSQGDFFDEWISDSDNYDDYLN